MGEETNVINQDVDSKNNDNNNQVTLKDLEPGIRDIVNAAIEKARKDEKDKLYHRIASLEEKLEKQKSEKEENEVLKEENEKLLSEIEKLKKEIQNMSKDNNKINSTDEGDETNNTNSTSNTNNINNVGEEKIKELESKIEALTSSFETTLKESIEKAISGVEQKQVQKEIDAYREQAIANAGLPENIAKLIPSTSIEEIDKTIAEITTELAVLTQPKGSGSLLSKTHVNPVLRSTDMITTENIANMSHEEYIKFREKNPHLFNGGQRVGFSGTPLRTQ